MELTSGLVRAEQQDGIGWLIYDNPEKLNAISQAMVKDALAVVEAYAATPSVQVVVVRGAGEKAFVSGGDISKFEVSRSDAEASRRHRELFARFEIALQTLAKPVIAMVHGYCLGGGVAVALSADLRFASSKAQFGIPAAHRGIVYPAAILKRLLDAVGPSAAKDLMFSARRIGADEALKMGLVDRVFPVDALETETVAYALAVAANAPLSVRASKFFIAQLGRDEGAWDEAAMQAMTDEAADSEDFKEATRAFAEKRKPVFRGR